MVYREHGDVPGDKGTEENRRVPRAHQSNRSAQRGAGQSRNSSTLAACSCGLRHGPGVLFADEASEAVGGVVHGHVPVVDGVVEGLDGEDFAGGGVDDCFASLAGVSPSEGCSKFCAQRPIPWTCPEARAISTV